MIPQIALIFGVIGFFLPDIVDKACAILRAPQ